ncbi:hypothetical protein [Rhodococcus sp. HNM0569]|uniref:hypothetical protein n=1 Tax=Rhodococcus sp. HNM0569 TaxID=2716340 RepID=UPI00146D895A|nr:hypothetical protein [Rhodococcus sp. HNM0569]NLU84718.1 hypothetical protein [Rhodococcus sp. HNM0569]
MENAELSDYAIERFGDLAAVIQNSVIETVHEAQEAALRVHAEHGLPERDPYGTSFRGHLNRRLLAKLRNVPGIRARKPVGHHTRYELPVIEETGVVLYWWRVPGDGRIPLVEARIRDVSRLQAHLMTFAPTAVEPQMTLEHATMSDEELDQLFTEDEQFSMQMAQVEGRTVTLWVSASPDGLYDFGWGDAELINAETGQLSWPRQESLKTVSPVVPTLKLVGHDDEPIDRFDSNTDQDNEFGLSLRAPQEEISSEAQQDDADDRTTGSEDS